MPAIYSDPLAQAERVVLDAVGDFQQAISACVAVGDALRLLERIDQLDSQMWAASRAALRKADQLCR